MKEYSDCAICEKPFWVKDLKKAVYVCTEDENMKMTSFICKKCKKDMDGMHDPYIINMCDGPQI